VVDKFQYDHTQVFDTLVLDNVCDERPMELDVVFNFRTLKSPERVRRRQHIFSCLPCLSSCWHYPAFFHYCIETFSKSLLGHCEGKSYYSRIISIISIISIMMMMMMMSFTQDPSILPAVKDQMCLNSRVYGNTPGNRE
jgi:hypothetical protein